MSQVSKYKLDKDIKREMFQQFWASVTKLRDAASVSSFFTDLLTDTEEIMLAKRFTIAVLLLRGRRPVDISQTLHVAYSTINSVGSWVKNLKPRSRKAFEEIIEESNWQVLLDKIDELLDELPPLAHTNWSHAGKAKWQRKMDRSSRRSLR